MEFIGNRVDEIKVSLPEELGLVSSNGSHGSSKFRSCSKESIRRTHLPLYISLYSLKLFPQIKISDRFKWEIRLRIAVGTLEWQLVDDR